LSSQAADPGATGVLRVAVDEREFTFHLPLASLLPKKFDPKSGDEFPGNYSFNPFSGEPLVNER